MRSSGRKLTVIDTVNPKDVIIDGLEKKILEQGELRQVFDITKEYPSRETYRIDEKEGVVIKRRIVVRLLENSVNTYAIGNQIDEEKLIRIEGVHEDGEYRDLSLMGWVDKHIMEISIWSPDANDRDNIMELVKLWMLELEQDIRTGDYDLPHFFDRNVFAVRFLRGYEDKNYEILTGGGPLYIGTLMYQVISPFFHVISGQEYTEYKLNLVNSILKSCINDEEGVNTNNYVGHDQSSEVDVLEDEIRQRQNNSLLEE